MRDRPQHRRPRALEALPRRHRRPSLDRRRGQRRVPPHDRARRQHHQPDVDRRPRLFPSRRRRRRQPLLVPARRRGLRRHTDHDDFYARHAQTDGKRIVYQCGAQSVAVRPGERRDARVPIAAPGASHAGGAQVRPRGRPPRRRSNVHPAGHSLAVDARGQLFTFACGKARCASTAQPTAHAIAIGQWLADGTTLVAVSDASGRGARRVFEPARRPPTALAAAGTSATSIAMRAAPTRHAGRLRQPSQRGAGRRRRRAASSPFDRQRGRPQRRPRLVARRRLARLHVLDRRAPLRDQAARRRAQASRRSSPQPEFRDYAPAFDPEGKYLYFLSLRTFDPVYDAVQFELSFPRAARPYLIALQAGGTPPFEPDAEGAEDDAEPDEAPKTSGEAADADPRRPRRHRASRRGVPGRREPLRPDRRRRRPQGDLDACCRSSARTAAAATRRRRDARAFDFATRAPRRSPTRSSASRSPPIAATLVLRDGKRAARDRRPRTREPTATPGERERRAVAQERLDRSRPRARLGRAAARMAADAARGLAAAARPVLGRGHVGRRLGRASTQHYAPLLERVSTRAELSDLIWEMQGELGTSHAYEMGGDHRKPPAVALGHLGGRPALGGRRCGATRSRHRRAATRGTPAPTRRSMRSASRPSPASASSRSTASATSRHCRRRRCSCTRPARRSQLTLESAARCAARRARHDARRRSAGALSRMGRAQPRVGARAVATGGSATSTCPTCSRPGFAEFHRYFGAECDREALIVDLRYNRGGHVSQLLLEKVARRRIGYDLQRWGQPIAVSRGVAGGAGGRAHQRACRLRRRHLLAQLQADEDRPAGRHAHLGRRGRHLAAPHAGRRHRDDAAGVLVLVPATSAGRSRTTAPIPRSRSTTRRRTRRPGRDRQLETALEVALQKAAAAPPKPDFGARPQLTRKPLPSRR